MTSNPFTFGNPVRDPARFFGRRQEIRQITGRLLSSAVESTSIVGERRIGKTSLLLYLANPEVVKTLGLKPDQYCLVYIDFQGLTDITPQRFWQRVLSRISRTISNKELHSKIKALRMQDSFDLFDLEDLFEEINDCGLNIILLMDEFEYVTQNSNFGSDFFGGLRALAIHHGLALIPATRRELVDLCHSEEIKGSPFFNIFANVVLRPFSQEDLDDFIQGYLSATEKDFTISEREILKELGGNHPFFLQIAGYYLIEGKLQGYPSDELAKVVAKCFDEQADPHYQYMWSHCSESEKITLLVLIGLSHQKHSKKTISSKENISRLYPRAAMDLNTLDKRGITIEREGIISLFSPRFEHWIRLEMLASPGEEEDETSVEKWLSEGGKEDLLEAKGFIPRFKRRYWPVLGNILKEVSFEFAAGLIMSLVT
jgi:AAA+ ATPase superfamily predicted ATPase